MRPRTIAFVIAALLGAALFARLGVWQVSRLHERQARNAVIRERRAAPPLPMDSLRVADSMHDWGERHGYLEKLYHRRARITGVASYNGEVIVAQRTHDGSPGVWLVTPVRSSENEPATIVVRGWAYSPDGVTVDRARWREGDNITVEGWLDEMPGRSPNPYVVKDRPDVLRRLDVVALAEHAGVPLRWVVLWATGPAPTDPSSGTPARFTLSELDDGPHRSYAIQWFSFAAIALVGAGIVVRNDMRTQHETAREPALPATRV